MHVFPGLCKGLSKEESPEPGTEPRQNEYTTPTSLVWAATIPLAGTAWRLCGTFVYVCSMLHICIYTYTIDRVSVITEFNFSKQMMPARFVNLHFHPEHNYDNVRIVTPDNNTLWWPH